MSSSCLLRAAALAFTLGAAGLPTALAQTAPSRPAAPTDATPASAQPGSLAKPYEYAQQMPEFAGGDAALRKFLNERVVYPAAARQSKLEGRVFLKFVVDETGQAQNPVVLKGLGGGLDEEALRVVGLLPRFATPGRQNGRPVCVYYSVPVTFSLQ